MRHKLSTPPGKRARLWALLCLCALPAFDAYAAKLECSEAFRRFAMEIHRPGLAWGRSLPQTGSPFRWAQVKGYVYLVVKSLRPPKPVDEKARRQAIQTIDSFFDEVIKGYPESTQTKLKKIYHEGTNQVFTKGYFESTLNLANWHFGKNGIDDFSVEFDEGFRDAELIRKMLLIHECAVHIGQMDQRMGQVGAQQMAAEQSTQDGYLYTEMSAALAEKTALSAIDFAVVEAETNRISDPVVRGGALGMFYAMSRMSPRQYVELLHRRESMVPTPAQVDEFLRAPN